MLVFYLKFYNILVDWLVINIILFCKIFVNDKVFICIGMYLIIVDRNLLNFFVMIYKIEKF